MPKQLRAGFPRLNQLWHLIFLNIHAGIACFSFGCSHFKIKVFYQTQMMLLNWKCLFWLHRQIQTWNICQDRKTEMSSGQVWVLRAVDIQAVRYALALFSYMSEAHSTLHSAQLSLPSVWSHFGPNKVFSLRAERNLKSLWLCGSWQHL